MKTLNNLSGIVPVLPSANLERDVKWYNDFTGFESYFIDKKYAGLSRDGLKLHLQWHENNADDPLYAGSIIRIFVHDIQSIFNEFVERGTVGIEKLMRNTPWSTHEFGFYDLNNNAIFLVQEISPS